MYLIDVTCTGFLISFLVLFFLLHLHVLLMHVPLLPRAKGGSWWDAIGVRHNQEGMVGERSQSHCLSMHLTHFLDCSEVGGREEARRKKFPLILFNKTMLQ